MATTIVTKNSSTASAVPTAAQLVQGELAVNVADKRIYTENNAGAVVELGTNPSTLTVTGEITANGGIALGDNDKATFGDSDDLQIYHNGNSFISDNGAGNLYLTTNDAAVVLSNADGSKPLAIFNNNADSTVYFNGSPKLATTATGIDVTGTATMDGLVVDGAATIEAATGHLRLQGTTNTNKNISLLYNESGDYGQINCDESGVNQKDLWMTGLNLKFGRSTSSESMRIDSSGNVGIGTSSLTGGNTILNLSRTGSGVGCNMQFANSHNGAFYVGLAGNTSGDAILHSADGTAGMAFGTGNTERMRIDSSGNLLVGTSSASGMFTLVANQYNAMSIQVSANGNVGASWKNASGSEVGYVQVNASSTLYSTSSDQRLKKNIADANDAGSKIDAIQVRQYDWKSDGSHQDYGMVAQELQLVAPEAVSGDADSEDMMGVDYSKLVPMLIKEIQSLRNRVAQLEA